MIVQFVTQLEGFAKKLEEAKAAVYKVNRRFMPNWMLVSPDMMPIITFVPGFKPASNSIANGPSLVYQFKILTKNCKNSGSNQK